MSADQEISQNSRKAKHQGADAHLRDRNRRETGLISYHRAVLRNLSAYFALGGVIVGLRPNKKTCNHQHEILGSPAYRKFSGDCSWNPKAVGLYGFMPPTGEMDVQKLFEDQVLRLLAQEGIPDQVNLLMNPLRNPEQDRRHACTPRRRG